MLIWRLSSSLAALTSTPGSCADFRAQAGSLLSRSISTRKPTEGSLCHVIINEHTQILALAAKILSSSDHPIKTAYQNQFVWETARHAIAKELVAFPADEKYLVDGTARAEKDRHQTAVLKKQLYDFQRLCPTHDVAGIGRAIKQLCVDLEEHFREEELQDFPKLEEAVGGKESRRLAKSFERTKLFVSTRSHPSSPDRPVGNHPIAILTCETKTESSRCTDAVRILVVGAAI
ncbi:hypothetical protein QFC22_004394 [Naganishia vaughanmartiniae]|uniref:Uncharacterized protein n=1 Tax=Naganishia vaughanmartiniae TaxID=1424756 RepID=A0ACC2X298_9TREE|nr:hypothetical protein QFC22_004394 [Naganishia vaughanmartiniae]